MLVPMIASLADSAIISMQVGSFVKIYCSFVSSFLAKLLERLLKLLCCTETRLGFKNCFVDGLYQIIRCFLFTNKQISFHQPCTVFAHHIKDIL